MIIGTAGHIDHGKTALVRALTGVDTDRLPEEKRRGITIDLGFAPLVIDGLPTIGIVDVPGHEAFVRTMLAGASGIDLALLVVAADEGIMPQTREHLEILSLLGIPKAIVALTKCDLVDDEWLPLVTDDVSALMSSTAFAGAEVIPVSAVTLHGLTVLRDAIARAALDVSHERLRDDMFRMPVDRAFTVKGTGTVITGTVWTGKVERDATVFIQPMGLKSRIRGIQSHDKPVVAAMPGMRAALALADCDVAAVPRGTVLVVEPEWTPTTEVEASLSLHAGFAPTARTRLRFHIGTSETGARLVGMHREGTAVVARVILDEPVIARGRDPFVIRLPSPARTVGGGRVLDPYPPPRRRGKRAVVHAKGRASRLEELVETAGAAGVTLKSIPIRTGLTPAQSASELDAIGAFVTGSRAFSANTVQVLESSVETLISLEMANHPIEPGVSLQTVRARFNASPDVMDAVVTRLAQAHRIELSGSIVRPYGWVSTLGEREQALSDAILHEVCLGSAEPPSVTELADRFGGSTRAMLRRLEREGRLERISDDRYYGQEVVGRIIGEMRSKLQAGRIYAPAELREVLGVSRKYLIPFLEFCDRKGITERRENGRIVRQTSI